MNKNIFRSVFAILAVAILFLLSPVIWSIVNAGIGLVAIAGLAALGIAIIQFIPLLGQKLENMILGLRKAEARQNPIEQLDNFFLKKRQQVNEFKSAVIKIGGQIKNMETIRDKRIFACQQSNREFDPTKQNEAIEAMKAAHNTLKAKYQNAESALIDLSHLIEDKKFEHEFAIAGQQAISSLSNTSAEELINNMLAGEANKAIAENFHAVFAELEIEATKINDQKQLTFSNGAVLDVSDIKFTEKVYK